MLNSENVFLPKSVYESNKEGVRVARPDIIIKPTNLATSFLTINRAIAQINSQEVLFLSRSDLIDSPFVTKPKYLKDTGARVKIPNLLGIDTILLTSAKRSLTLSDYVPTSTDQVVVTRDTTGPNVGRVSTIEISIANIPDGVSVQVEILQPNQAIS